jgi:GH25 family lysozyme M1 (1,4-beta-N-acetylmuramidase)
MPDYGIDVASFNPIVNWAAVRNVGNSWMWSKATQGAGYANPLFGAQIEGARSVGLLVGAYHFPDPNVSVAANVGHFMSVAAGRHTLDPGCFVPMLDVEDDPADGIVWTPASANAFVLAFRDEFRRETGVHELCVYGSESWFATGKLDPAQWADDGVVLCVAQYTGIPGQVSWTHPRAAVHQYTDNAPTPGATKPTDRSTTLGSWSAKQLTIGGGVSPAITTPGDIMFEFVADLSTPANSPFDPKTGYKSVLRLVGGGMAEAATWADVCAKDRSYGGDGTGSVLGLDPAAYAATVATDALVRAALKNMGSLTPSGSVATAPVPYAIEVGGAVIGQAVPQKS